jgi:PAS domain S-box-containing protein
MEARETKSPVVEREESDEEPDVEVPQAIGVPAPATAVHADESTAAARAEAVRDLVGAATRAGLIVFRFSPARGLTFLRGPSSEFLGYSAEELFNDPALANRVVHPEFLDAIGLFSMHLYESDSGPMRLEIPFLTRAGATVFMEVFVAPLYDAEGRVESFAGVAVGAQGSSATREKAEALVGALSAPRRGA